MKLDRLLAQAKPAQRRRVLFRGEVELHGRLAGLLDLVVVFLHLPQQVAAPGLLFPVLQRREPDGLAGGADVAQAVEVLDQGSVELVAVAPAQRAQDGVLGTVVVAPPPQWDRAGQLEVPCHIRIGAGDDVDRVADEATIAATGQAMGFHDQPSKHAHIGC